MKIRLAGKTHATGPGARVVVAPDTHWDEERAAILADLEAYAKERGLKVTQPFVGHGDYFELVPVDPERVRCPWDESDASKKA
jgi:hypothetical protein